MREKKILQITPASEWAAIFNDNGTEVSRRLAVWALVQYEDGTTAVEGMTGTGEFPDFAQGFGNFLRYQRYS